jgi:hypothetical protein
MNRLVSLLTLSAFVFSPALVQAESDFFFDPNYIVSDVDFLDTYSMSLQDIERFLLRGGLADYTDTDLDGKERSAAEIIYNAAHEFDISPRFLLVLLQREQSLVEDDSPSENQLDWAMGYAVCDSCSKSDPRIQKFKGFANQIHYAAQRIRESYIADLEEKGQTLTGIGPGIETEIDGTSVTPVNFATSSLYTYTPHLHGNENFAKIWERWFVYTYPNGSLLQDRDNGAVWLIQYGMKRPITSRTALYSRFNESSIVQVSASALDSYIEGAPISFPNYSLLRSPGGTVYLIIDDTRRGFASQEAFRSIGFSPDEIVDVAWEDLDPYTEIEPITANSANPQATLLQDASTGGIYYVESGVRHPIHSREILQNRFSLLSPEPTPSEDIELLELGEAVGFSDGTLIAAEGSGDIFVVTDGQRRHIVDEQTFYSFGWNWNQVVWTNERSVLLHELGDPLQLNTSFENQELLDIATNL